MKAVILAGGYGKRLRPLTENKPKPLLEVLGLPILLWQLEWLKKAKIRDIILCTGYMKEAIINYVGSGNRFGVKVGYAVEEEPIGTGGALKNAETLLSNEDTLLVCNGDIITDLDPRLLMKNVGKKLIGNIAVVPLRSPYGIIDLSNKSYVKGFQEKPILTGYWINAGAYCLSSDIFSYLPEKGNIENTAFPKLAKEGRLGAIQYRNVIWRSIDSHKDIEEAERELKPTLTARRRRSKK